jgi:hypothetical protein
VIGTQQFREMEMREQRSKGTLLKAAKRPKKGQTVEVTGHQPMGAHLSTAAKRPKEEEQGFQDDRLLHVDAEYMKSLQAVRPAKPAKPPDRLRRSPAYSRVKMSRSVHAAGEEMLLTSGTLAGALEVAATQEGSQWLRGRELCYSGTEDRWQELLTGPSHRVRITRPRPAAWPDEPPGGSRVPPEGSRDQRPSRELRPPCIASPRRPKERLP